MTFGTNKSDFTPNAAAEVKICIFFRFVTKIAKLSYLASLCFSGCFNK